MARVILDELESREIKAHYFHSNEHQAFVIAVENEEFLPIALDIYRVKLGLKKPVEIDQEWVKIKSIPRGTWTLRILFFCVIVYLFSFFTIGEGLYTLFQIDSHESGFLLDVTRGQIWRVITPIFLHMGILHILFNMMWFFDLGNLFEHVYGKSKFFLFILISGIFSNLFQYIYMGPRFGGMSGVLYGLLSFIWIRQKIDPQFEYKLPKHDSTIMILWFFICLFGIIPHVANFAHAGGAFIGIVYASVMDLNENKWTVSRAKYLGMGIALLIVTVIVEKVRMNM